MNRYIFIAPTFNAVETCKQAILSLAVQSYDNWRLIVIDDMSTDKTELEIRNTFSFLGIYEKLTYIKNDKKMWEVANVLQGLKLCNDDDIICRMDLDDYLIDANALEIIDMQYQNNPNLDVVWSSHRWFEPGKLTNMNISKDLPRGSDPYVHPWVSSHFKTFRKSVLRSVKDENYRGPNSEYFKRIGDQVFMLPALKNAREWLHIPMPFYAYRCVLSPQTFQTDDAKFQQQEAIFLRSRGYIP